MNNYRDFIDKLLKMLHHNKCNAEKNFIFNLSNKMDAFSLDMNPANRIFQNGISEPSD